VDFLADKRICNFMKWQVPSPSTLHTRAWDDEIVVYDELSGNTHVLGQVAARVLAAIAQAPADSAALAQALPDLWADQTAGQEHAQLEAILGQLAGISLIAPATP
jgi:PqqD family protein of HPr-rel-A system